MAGSTPGTERWVLQLRTRTFAPLTFLRNARMAATAAQRLAALAQLEQATLNDQAEFLPLVIAAGGRIEKHFWATNALAVEIPPPAVARFAAHPRVRRMHPVGARQAAEAAAAPSGAALPSVPIHDPSNHNIGGARTYLRSWLGLTSPAAEGQGVVVAFFDTGIDADESGAAGSGIPHRSFVMPGNPAASRILSHATAGIAAAGGLDCNNVSAFFPFSYGLPPFAYRPCAHSTSTSHGTGMAGIACGNAAGTLPEGHAPQADLVDVSITIPGPQGVGRRWQTDVPSMLNAIEILRATGSSDQRVRILNLSFDGWSDPEDPVCAALDDMAAQDDVLVVTGAGNAADDSRLSYGTYNALAVGSVHARSAPTAPFFAMADTSRGPLAGTPRWYPDLCATGAGPGDPTNGIQYGFDNNSIAVYSMLEMPQVDPGDPLSIAGCTQTGFPDFVPISQGAVRYGRGTSEAAAQVSGAAALYMAARLQLSGQVTAEEARAAILVSLLSPHPGPNGSAQHAYASRNTFGLGYLRDDILAEFAVRDPAIQPRHEVRTLTAAQPVATINLTGLTIGARYSAAICWLRNPDGAAPIVDNIDLEVSTTLGAPVARSATPANSYEHVLFVAPTTSVNLVARLVGASGGGSTVVNFAFRKFQPDFDPTTVTIEATPALAATGLTEVLDNGAACAFSARPMEPARIVPLSYAQTYGSKPHFMPAGSAGTLLYPNLQGLSIAMPAGGAPGMTNIHIEMSGAAATGLWPQPLGQVGSPIVIGGIGFRTWRPFQITAPLTVQRVQMEWTGAGPVTTTSLQRSPSTAAVTVFDAASAPGTPLTLPAFSATGSPDWSPIGFGDFFLGIPFTTPFSYTAGNLHIWITWSGTIPLEYQVDGIQDAPNNPNYGWRVGGGSVRGTCPVLALLPDGTTLQILPPLLRSFGEPLVGSSVDAQVLHTPTGTPLAVLVMGLGQAGTGLPCLQHVDTQQATVTWLLPLDASGRGRQGITFATTPSLIQAQLVLQAVMAPMGPSTILTNGLRLTIGGGL